MTQSTANSAPVQKRQTIPLNQTTAAPITITGHSKASNVVNTLDKGPNPDYSIWVDAIQSDGSYATSQAK